MAYPRPIRLLLAGLICLAPTYLSAFSASDIDRAADQAKDRANSQGLDFDGAIDGAATAAKSYDGDLEADLKDLATELGLTYVEAIELLSLQRTANPLATKTIDGLIRKTGETCEQVPTAYQLSCLNKGLSSVANALPRRGDYAPVRSALSDVARELGKIAKANRDRSKPRVRLSDTRKPRTFTATQGAVAVSAGQNALELARSRLIRSVAANAARAVHYRQIAAAFRDTAVLLRS